MSLYDLEDDKIKQRRKLLLSMDCLISHLINNKLKQQWKDTIGNSINDETINISNNDEFMKICNEFPKILLSAINKDSEGKFKLDNEMKLFVYDKNLVPDIIEDMDTIIRMLNFEDLIHWMYWSSNTVPEDFDWSKEKTMFLNMSEEEFRSIEIEFMVCIIDSGYDNDNSKELSFRNWIQL